MLKRFTIRELVFIALMSSLLFVVDFFSAIWIVAATGIPLSGGILSVVIIGFFYGIIILTIRKFGTATIVALIYTALSSPTNNFGPPGFYKLIIGLVLGLILDFILYAGRYRKFAYYLGIFLSFISVAPVMLGTMILLGLPGVEELKGIVIMLMVIQGVEGVIGLWLGSLFYNKKLKNKRIIKQIQA